MISGRGPSARALEYVRGGRAELLISNAIVTELDELLHRDSIRRKFTHLDDRAVSTFLLHLCALSTQVSPMSSGLTFSRDSRDLPYLNLAIQSRAQYLVSRDADLLSIPLSDDLEAARIRALAPDLRIVDPVAFLDAIAK